MIGPLCWLTLLLILIPAPMWSAPLSVALSARLQAVLTTAIEPVPVIVRLRTSDVVARVQGMSRGIARRTLVADLKQQARQSQGDLIDFLRGQGVADPRSLWLINGLAFSATPQLIAQLASWPGVELISIDRTVPRPVVVPAAVAGVEWNIDLIGAPQLWNLGIDGFGVVVASLDTGVDLNHPDLSANWRGGANGWFDPYNVPPSPQPYDPASGDLSQGHGTAVMGVMVGGNSGGSAIGVAPGAEWISAKVFPDIGEASNAKILEALGWVLDPDNDPATDDGADIVNNSWGFDNLLGQCLSGFDLTNMQLALSHLRAAGAAVVFSAGNSGPLSGSSIPPGNMSSVLAVGAVDSRSEVALFSARGPSLCDAQGEIFPSLVAPGVAVRSATLTSSPLLYENVSGTSFSAPQVAGALALLRQAFPAKTLTELEAALQQGSIDLGPPGDDDDYGSGLLNVSAAYHLLQNFPPVDLGNTPPPRPTLQFPANGAVDVARPVTFSWQRDVDLDGDTVTDFLLISTHADFSDSTPITTALPQAVMLLAGGGLLFGGWRGGRARGWLLMLILSLSLLLTSCGGGGSASPASVPVAPTGEYQSTSLLPNTSYSWKIRAVDSRGGVSESAVRSFTTL